MAAPKKSLRETTNFWVLAEYKSKSNPAAKAYEVRTSKNDGKTYCTCRGWIVALNAGHSICTHIRQFKAGNIEEAIVVYDFESFAKVKRGLSLTTDAEVGTDTKVRRQ